MKRRTEDKPDLSPHHGLCVAPPRVQDPSLDSPLDGFPLSLGTEWRVYRIRFLRPVRIQHLLSLARSQSRPGVATSITLTAISLSWGNSIPQSSSRLPPVGYHCTFHVIRCQEPRRGRSLYAPEGGVIQLSLGFSLSRHRSKLVPES